MSVYIFVRSFVSFCLFVRLFVCLCVCLSASLPACLTPVLIGQKLCATLEGVESMLRDADTNKWWELRGWQGWRHQFVPNSVASVEESGCWWICTVWTDSPQALRPQRNGLILDIGGKINLLSFPSSTNTKKLSWMICNVQFLPSKVDPIIGFPTLKKRSR